MLFYEFARELFNDFRFSPTLWRALTIYPEKDSQTCCLRIKTAWNDDMLFVVPRPEIIKIFKNEHSNNLELNSEAFWKWFLKSHYIREYRDFVTSYENEIGQSISMYLRGILSDDKNVYDSGRYISGSKKEASFIRKLLSEQAKDDSDNEKLEDKIDVVFKKIGESIDDFKESTKILFMKDKDGDNIIFWSQPISTSYSLHKEWADNNKKLKSSIIYFLNRYSEKTELTMELLNQTNECFKNLSVVLENKDFNKLIKRKRKMISDESDFEDANDDSAILNDSYFIGKCEELIGNDIKEWIIKFNDINNSFIEMMGAFYQLNRLNNILSSFNSNNNAERVLFSDDVKTLKKIATKKAKAMGDAILYKELSGRKLIPNFNRTGGRTVSKEINVESFLEKFNLSGQEFGKSLSDKDRLELLKRAESGFMDLADILGVDDRRIGLNGSLSFALASRGKGGRGAAIAHYEPLQRVINLTKALGTDGSLAHEYGHALDFGDDGKSFFDITVDEIDDLDIRDAWVKLKKSITTGSKNLFLNWIENEIEYYKIEKESSLESYEMVTKESREIDARFRKEIINLEEKIRGIDVIKKFHNHKISFDDLSEENQLLLNQLKELVNEKKIQSVIYFYMAEPYRLYHNQCIQKSKELRTIKYHIESNGIKSFKDLLKIRSLEKNSFIQQINSELLGDGDWPSSFLIKSSQIDYNLSKGATYWSSGKEMFARAFESFISDKMKEEGRNNSFLTHDKLSVNKDSRVSPYPTGEERRLINESLDNFIEVAKIKKYF